jgi:hypothetical protein
MKEIPIIFSMPMVMALLNTKPNVWPAEPINPDKPFKSMTRRVIEPQPRYNLKEHNGGWNEYSENPLADPVCGSPWGYGRICKLKIGDILWVREAFHEKKLPYFPFDYYYKADCPESTDRKWKSPIFMPRKIARLFLEVKSIRTERLSDITLEDAKAEGMKRKYKGCLCHEKGLPGPCIENCPKGCSCLNVKELFYDLWESINAKRGYSFTTDPWVWVYEFMRIEKGDK